MEIGPCGLANKQEGPDLEVGPFVGHSLDHGGAHQVDADGGEGLGVRIDPLFREAAHPLGTEGGSSSSTD